MRYNKIMFTSVMTLLIVALSLQTGVTTEQLVTSINRYQGLSTDTKTTAGIKIGSTWYELDTSKTFIFDGSSWNPSSSGSGIIPVSDGPDTLDAPGKTIGVVSTGFNGIAYYIVLSSVDTDITFYLESKTNNGSDWTNVNANGDSTVANLDGTWVIQSTAVAPADSTRLFWSAESGGTGAEIIVTSERWIQ